MEARRKENFAVNMMGIKIACESVTLTRGHRNFIESLFPEIVDYCGTVDIAGRDLCSYEDSTPGRTCDLLNAPPEDDLGRCSNKRL